MASTRRLRAQATNATTATAEDPCGAQYWELGCLYPVTCDTCLSRPGCAIESTTGDCVSLARVQATVGVAYIARSSPGYCGDDDACTSCRTKDANGVCVGADGCVCVPQCLAQSAAALQCSTSSFTTSMPLVTLLAVLGFLVLLVIFVRRTIASPSMTAVRRLVQRHRERPDPSLNPMALKLDGWHKYMDAHQEQFEHVELQTCTVQLRACDMQVVECSMDPAPRKQQREQQQQQTATPTTATRARPSEDSRASTSSAQSCGSFICTDDNDVDVEGNAASDYAELASPSAARAMQERR